MFHRLLIGRGLTSFGRVYSGFQRRAVGAVKLHSSPDTQAIKLKRQLATVARCAATPGRGVKQMNPAAQISAATEGNALIAPDCLLSQLDKLQGKPTVLGPPCSPSVTSHIPFASVTSCEFSCPETCFCSMSVTVKVLLRLLISLNMPSLSEMAATLWPNESDDEVHSSRLTDM